MIEVDDVMTPKEVQAMLKVSNATLWRLRNQGILPFTKFGGTIRYSRKALAEFIQKNSTAALSTNNNEVPHATA